MRSFAKARSEPAHQPNHAVQPRKKVAGSASASRRRSVFTYYAETKLMWQPTAGSARLAGRVEQWDRRRAPFARHSTRLLLCDAVSTYLATPDPSVYPRRLCPRSCRSGIVDRRGHRCLRTSRAAVYSRRAEESGDEVRQKIRDALDVHQRSTPIRPTNRLATLGSRAPR
jgi:hypothetical protein